MTRRNLNPPKWWVKGICKGLMPLKNKCFCLLLLHNKILVWKNLQKTGYLGPGMCSLCRSDLDSVEHIFLNCAYFKIVWREVSCHFSFSFNWDLISIEDCFLSCFGSIKKWKFLPYCVLGNLENQKYVHFPKYFSLYSKHCF